MHIVKDSCGLRRRRAPIVLAAGFFDGVHRGHRLVLDAARDRARARGAAVWAMTFDVHPLSVLNPPAAPPLLTGNSHKLRLLDEIGIDGVWMLPFDLAMARRSREDFARMLVEQAPALREIFAGRNWRFGRDAGGSAEWLSCWASSHGHDLSVFQTAPATMEGHCISSSWVRAAVGAGRLGEAGHLLGRMFSVWGKVVKGRGVGRQLGFPTANLAMLDECLPPPGVYAGRAIIEPRRRQRRLDAVLNLGRRPTLGPESSAAPTLEVHLLDEAGELYGSEMEVAFGARMRDERAFSSRAELAGQIREDVGQARALLPKIMQK